MTPFVIVVNRHRVAANRRRTDGHLDPVFRVSRGKSGKPTYVHRCLLAPNAVLMYSPGTPLPCGATAWIETDSVRVQGPDGRHLITL